jgi:hypothetical protein
MKDVLSLARSIAQDANAVCFRYMVIALPTDDMVGIVYSQENILI